MNSALSVGTGSSCSIPSQLLPTCSSLSGTPLYEIYVADKPIRIIQMYKGVIIFPNELQYANEKPILIGLWFKAPALLTEQKS